MPETCTYDYAIIRVVPRVEREEFINVGVILSCPGQDFLEARIEPDIDRLKNFSPLVDVETVTSHLEMIKRICAGDEDSGPIGKLPPRSRFYWLTAQRSTIIQTSPIHTGISDNAERLIERLMERMVR